MYGINIQLGAGERHSMRALIVAVLLAVTGSACAVDAPAESHQYSCLIRFQCVDSDDILTRQHFSCSTDVEGAEDVAQGVSYAIADDRCGVGQWQWTWTECNAAAAPLRCEVE